MQYVLKIYKLYIYGFITFDQIRSDVVLKKYSQLLNKMQYPRETVNRIINFYLSILYR